MMATEKDGQATKPQCAEHNCDLDYYCESCEESLCMCCALTQHSSHRYGTVEQVVARYKGEIKGINTVIDNMVKAAAKAHKHIDALKRNQSNRLDEMNRHNEEQIRKFAEAREQAKRQFCDEISKKQENYTAQLQELDVIQKELSTIRRLNGELEQRFEGESDIRLTKVKQQKQVIDKCMEEIDAKQRKIDSQFGHIDDSTKNFTSFKQSTFNPSNCELLFPESLHVNKPTIAVLCTRDSHDNLCKHCGNIDIDNDLYIKLESITGKVVHAKVKDNCDGSYNVAFTPQHIGKATLTASINGQHVKGSPYSVIVHQNYDFIPVIIVTSDVVGKDCKQPWGIALGKYRIWAVTDYYNHCVYLLYNYHPDNGSRRNQLLRKVGSQGSGDGQFQNPRGVAFDCKNNLYVVDGNNHRIQKFDVRGNYLLDFGDRGVGDGQLSSPHGIAVHDGRIYIADSGNKRVAVFQITGQFCLNIGERVLGIPCDVTVNINNDMLLVAVYGQNCLNAFTLDGQSKGNFGKLQQNKRTVNDSIMYPCGLTTDLNGFVLVSETCTKCIEVLDQDGNLVKSHVFNQNAKFLNNGFSLGTCIFDDSCLTHPLAVASSPEGGVLVTIIYQSSVQKLMQDDFPIR